MRTLNQRVGFLLQRYVDSTCTPDEFAELIALLRLDIVAPEIEQVLERVLADAVINPREQQIDWEKMRLAILQRQPPVAPIWQLPVAPLRRLRPFRRMVAAAVILAVLAGGAWWILARKTRPETTIAAQPQKDVVPGGNKAVLTLSNGSAIILDSAANGLVSQQGQSKVLKLTNGQLSYQSAGGRIAELVYNTVSTPRGGTYEVTLPDGTRVWLNASSSLRFPTAFPGKERRVEISGEAYFDVIKKPRQPFKVGILSPVSGENRGVVEVLGTSFDINAYTDESVIATTLVNGSVKVSVNGSVKVPGNSNGNISGKDNTLTLRPGQQAEQSAGGTLSVNPDADIEKITAWKEGRFVFDRDGLPAIMRQLARWYDVEVEYRGSPPTAHFSGIISRSKNLSQVLNMLKATENIRFTIEDKKIIIFP